MAFIYNNTFPFTGTIPSLIGPDSWTWKLIQTQLVPRDPHSYVVISISYPSRRAGTAFFIAPISLIHYRSRDIEIPLAAGDSGKYAKTIKTWLKNIMYGKESHEWGVVIQEETIAPQ